jgi:hypothetical protein
MTVQPGGFREPMYRSRRRGAWLGRFPQLAEAVGDSLRNWKLSRLTRRLPSRRYPPARHDATGYQNPTALTARAREGHLACRAKPVAPPRREGSVPNSPPPGRLLLAAGSPLFTGFAGRGGEQPANVPLCQG